MKHQRFGTIVSALGALLAAGLTATAGSVSYNFDTDPSGILQLFGNATWYPSDGNPNSGGYLSLTDAGGSQRSAIIFDDFDNGLVVKAFSFSMDVRIGGGTDNPADGISINYVRANDPVLSDPLNGWATGPNGEADLPEEGSTTGLGIGFDAWYSGGDGSSGTNPHTLTDDMIGISVRLDGQLIYQTPLPTINGACTDPTSLQTGPQDAGNPNSPDLLCWEPLNVSLAENGTLIIKYKGVEMTPAGGLHTTFAPSQGRLVLVGRTGSANENHHIDNIQITTIAATEPTVGNVSSDAIHISFTITDAGSTLTDTNTVALTLNGLSLPIGSISKSGAITAIAASTLPNLIPAGSTNQLVVSFKDSLGNPVSATRTFVETPYAILPEADALPATAIDTTKPGFKIRSYQVDTDNQTSLALAEEELHGLLGPNLSDLSQAGADGFITETGVINYARAGDDKQGNFDGETTLPGFPGTGPNGYDYGTLEILTYLQIPAPGVYKMGVNSDDGFRVRVAPSVGEKLAAVTLGEFNGGRGSDSPSLFSFYASKAGFYPVRTIWENGGGGANIEWYSVNDDGTYTLINDAATATAIKAFQASSVILPYIDSARPEPGLFAEGRAARADEPIEVQLVDGSADAINQSSIKLSLNSTSLSPVITKSGTRTTILVNSKYPNLLPIGTNTVTLIYSAGASAAKTNSWQFIVNAYPILDIGTSLPIGSGDPAHPGFRLKTYQIDVTSPTAGQAGGNQSIANVGFAEQELLGLFGTNAANLGSFTNGYYFDTGVINFDKDPATDGTQGNFGNESPFPGIPGLTAYSLPDENFALEMQTYVEFPATGFYTLGFNSDDGFSVYNSTAPGPIFALNINSPSNIAGYLGAVSAGSDDGGIAKPLPKIPITAKVVYAVPAIADSDLTNTNEIAGNIALIDRGVVAFTDKLNRAIKAGAVGVIMVNNRDESSADGILPIVMGGAAANIPAVMVGIHDGQKIKDHLGDAGGVTASLGADPTPRLGVYNGGRGASDTIFNFLVPQAGVYPIRGVYFQGGGGASAEWFSVADDGTKILLNDTTTPGALKAYSSTLVATKPVISITTAGSDIVITFTGTLQTADVLTGSFSDSTASSPLHVPLGSAAAAKFYRSRN